MKRIAMICAMLAVACFAFAQYGASNQQQNPPSGQPGATQQPGNAGQQGAANPPAAKHPPQAKTQPEYDAFKVASANQDPAALEKAADDFAAKFPESELRVILYKTAMRDYQNVNNGDKMLEMARRVLSIDPDDPEGLTDAAEVLVERTRDTDLDKDQKLDEAKKDAEKALQTVDTDVVFPPQTPPDKVEAYKNLLRSSAYSILGTLEFNRNNFAGAETNFRKSIDAYPQQPDPVTVLRLSLALDRQNKYPEALAQANRAVEMTQEGSAAGGLARRERDRLIQLTGGKPATPPAGAAAQPQQQNPSTPNPGGTNPPKQ
jgi:tetratricopeptide (TPR) repeat protein